MAVVSKGTHPRSLPESLASAYLMKEPWQREAQLAVGMLCTGDAIALYAILISIFLG